MSQMDDVFTTLDGRQIMWTDKRGVTHRCEGSDIHPGIRLLWTCCHKDVPANAAFLQGDMDKVDCQVCVA